MSAESEQTTTFSPGRDIDALMTAARRPAAVGPFDAATGEALTRLRPEPGTAAG